jgi:hypothetical protein
MTAKEYEHHDAAAPEPVAYFDPQKREFYWARPTQIDAPTAVDVPPLPLYAAPPAQMREEAFLMGVGHLKADNERLRGLLAEASKAVWMNYDNDLLDRIEAALKEVRL